MIFEPLAGPADLTGPELNIKFLFLKDFSSMTDLYRISLGLIFGFAVLVFVLLFFITAPYGKFQREGWGPLIKSKWAWMIMEAPSPVLMLLLFVYSDKHSYVTVSFILLWLSHYLHRTLVYPFTQAGREKPYPILLALMAFLFNMLNGFANGYGIFNSGTYDHAYFCSWNYFTGAGLFITGFIINKLADEELRKTRKRNPGRYVIPDGRFFKHVSCPHYFGEIVEWGGWALMTWSLPGLAFFIFTAANLIPRAVATHRWYKTIFDDYPLQRKAIIPFLV
jgi:protein-S-isoprenylcysteine O-methyltransferase Ste14